MSNKNVPEVRFPNFNNIWEQYKLGEIVDIKDSARISNVLWESDGVPYLRSSDLADTGVGGELFISDETYLSYKNRTGAPEKDDVLFTSGGKVGITYHKVDDNPVYVQGGSILYAKTSTSSKLSGKYLNSFFSSPMMIKYMRKASTGLTLKHFTLKPANAAPIFIPSLEEQTKIGNFFKQLNETIDSQQQELTILKQTKQGFLQKMFPKEGEAVPEVRFPGFTESWKYSRIGEITESYSGGTPSAKNKLYYGGNIPFIRSGEINASNTELFLTESGFNNSSAKIVEKGDILYALYGATSGEVGISQINGAINQAILAIKPRSDNNSNFIMQWLKRQKSSITSTYLQGGQGNLSGSIVKELIIPIPQNIKEQVVIGTFFKQIDKVITLHEQELEALQLTKKAFLQKMFV